MPWYARKEKMSVSFMYGDDVNEDKGGVGLPALYTIAAPMDGKHNEWQITAHEFIHEQKKDSYCRQTSCTECLPKSGYKIYRNELWTHVASIDDAI